MSTPLPELADWVRQLTGVISGLDHVPTGLADAFRQFPVWAALGLVGALLLLIGRRRKPSVTPAHPTAASQASAPATPTASAPTDAKAEFGAVLRSFKGAFLGLALFSGISNILMLTGSMFMLEIYDRVLPSRSVPTLVGLAILAGILFLGQGILDFVRGRILANIGAALDEAVSGRIYTTIVRLPLFVGHRGEGLQPLRDLDTVRGFLSGPGLIALFDLPWLPLYLIVIFAFHPILGFAALFGAIVLVVLTIVVEVRTRQQVQAATAAGVTRNALAEAGRRNAEVAVAMGMTGRMEAKFQDANRDYIKQQKAISDVVGGFSATSRVLRMVLQSAMLGIGAYLVIIQQATSGIIIAGSIIAGRALAPVDQAIAHWKSFVGARQSWQRLNKLMKAFPGPKQPMALPNPAQTLSVQNVSVAAPGTNKILINDVSLTLQAGQGLGIIGPSASGKSTLARALVGTWRPAAGRVTLDGASLDQWAPDALGRHIGYLPQDVELFDGTIAENICRFETNADPVDILLAASAAGVHEMIVGLRGGYEAPIGHEGTNLSAGQRQRIALARALYRNPFLVVLDEPNSNLDTEGELALVEAIRGVRQRGGIVVIIAHRPIALSVVDFALVMNQGRVQGFGPRDEVLGKLFPKLHPGAPAKIRMATSKPSGNEPTPGGDG